MAGFRYMITERCFPRIGETTRLANPVDSSWAQQKLGFPSWTSSMGTSFNSVIILPNAEMLNWAGFLPVSISTWQLGLVSNYYTQLILLHLTVNNGMIYCMISLNLQFSLRFSSCNLSSVSASEFLKSKIFPFKSCRVLNTVCKNVMMMTRMSWNIIIKIFREMCIQFAI
jgi:hypothetical protein